MSDQTKAALDAAFHSTYVTALALASGLLASAIAAGAAGSPQTLWAYARANAFGYLVAQVVAPTLRAAAAAQKAGT